MPHPVFSALRPDAPVAFPARPAPSPPWTGRGGDTGPEVAVLITGCHDVAAAVRGYRTVLPRAQVILYSDDPHSDAEVAGAVVRRVAPCTRDALVRRMFAEVDADIYILAHGAGAEDVCVAPLVVSEIDGGGKDLVDVARFDCCPGRDAGDRLLARTVDFLFGRGGDTLASDFKACSRRFALSYRAAAADGGTGRASALALALHALRLRMPMGQVAALAAARRPAGPRPARDLAGWIALLGLVARLLAEERPRRVFGLLGVAVMAAGIAAALPAMQLHGWRATLPRGPVTLLSLGLMGTGGAIGTAGLLLDSLASARQEVRRLGTLTIPRRAERSAPQSSVS